MNTEQSPKQFKVSGFFLLQRSFLSSSCLLKINENSPNGTIIGTIQRYSSNYVMTLIDDANGRFVINALDQLIVSVFIYSFRKTTL